VTALDWVILAALALSAASGFQRGVVVTALSLLGAALGALIGLLLGTALSASTAPAAPAAAALLALVGGLLGAGLLGRAGRRLRGRWLRPVSSARSRRSTRLLRTAPAQLDRLLGAVLGAVIACGLAWLIAGAARTSDAPPAAREAVRESLVLGGLRTVLPSATPILDRLGRWNPLPTLLSSSADAPRGIARDPDVRAAQESVVRVVGAACGRRSSGSGWIAARGLVVTNAHVVAGQRGTWIQLGGRGRRLDAVAVAFDERNDIAILRVAGMDAPALRLAPDAAPGAPVALLGFPGGFFRVRGGRLGAERQVVTRSDPGGRVASRVIRRFESAVRPGNSGGPIVDSRGRVVATAFAVGDERNSRQGYAVPNGPVRRALAGIRGPVGTGSCPSGAPSVGAPMTGPLATRGARGADRVSAPMSAPFPS